MSNLYQQLRSLNVNSQTEKKSGLTYLSWSWAWDIFKSHVEDATYEIIKNPEGLPFFESPAGVMVFTKVTANGLTYEMFLPVMDGANKAMKREGYSYKTKFGPKEVEPFSMFDVNKALMRCLVKNLAMFGLGLYIYSGEDLPSEPIEVADPRTLDHIKSELSVAALVSPKALKAVTAGIPLAMRDSLRDYVKALKAPMVEVEVKAVEVTLTSGYPMGPPDDEDE